MRFVWTKTGLCMRVGGLGGEAVRLCLAEMLTLILALIDSVNWLLTPGVELSEAWTAAKQQTGGNRSSLRWERLHYIFAKWNSMSFRLYAGLCVPVLEVRALRKGPTIVEGSGTSCEAAPEAAPA